MDAQCLEGDAVLDKGQGDHRIELSAEGLVGGEVFDESKVVHDHLLAAALDRIVDEVEQPLLLKTFDRTIDEIFGDLEVLLGEGVDLVGGHGLGVVAGEDEDESLFVGTELLLEELLHHQGRVPGVFCHSGERTAFEEVVESDSGGTAVLESEELLVVQREELYRGEACLLHRCTAQ